MCRLTRGSLGVFAGSLSPSTTTVVSWTGELMAGETGAALVEGHDAYGNLVYC